MHAKVIPFQKPTRVREREETLQERTQATLQWMIASELGAFASHLGTARYLFRRYPDLVTAAEFPAYLREAHKAEYDREPEDGDIIYEEPTISPERMKELRERAAEYARYHLAQT